MEQKTNITIDNHHITVERLQTALRAGDSGHLRVSPAWQRNRGG